MSKSPLSACLIFTSLLLSSCFSTSKLEENQALVKRNVILNNNTNVENYEIEDYIKQKPNRKTLGFIKFHLGAHNLVNHEKAILKRKKKNEKIDRKNEKRLEKNKKPKSKDKLTFQEWLIEIGEPPVIYDSILAQKSSQQVELFLNNKGHFNSTVEDSVYIKRKKATCYYKIKASTPYTIRKIDYQIADVRLNYYVLNDTAYSLLRSGENYDVDVLQSERNRIANTLSNNGYYHFSKEYIHYEIDSALNSKQLDITLKIKDYNVPVAGFPDSTTTVQHQRYYIGNIYIQTDYHAKQTSSMEKDTLLFEDYFFLFKKGSELQYKPKIIASSVFLQHGALYQTKNITATYRRLAELSAFKFINLVFVSSPNQKNYLDCYVQLSPVYKQSFTVETEGTNTSGNLGVSGSVVYQNKNVFKGAEILEIKLKGGIEAQKLINDTSTSNTDIQQTLGFNTIEFGPEANLHVPKFLLPFNVKVSKSANPKTTFTSALNYQKRPDYQRNIFNLSYGYSWKETQQKRHTIIPVEISLVSIDLEPAFENTLEQLNDFIVITSYTDHLTTTSRYAFVFNNQDLKKNTNFTFFKFNGETSGNVLRMFHQLTGATKDGNDAYNVFGIRYAHYLRADLDYRYYFIFSKYSRLVMRAAGGVGHPLKNLDVLPFERSFFGGGANSIRAWEARSLGPGSFPSTLVNRFDQIGDAQLEGNVEYRFNLFKKLNAAFFVDAGNIWLRKPDPNRPGADFFLDTFYKEIAVGSGLGARLDLSFFILRLDLGIKMRDPIFADKERWVIQHLFDRDWKNEFIATHEGTEYRFMNLNLAIGYPF